MMLESKSVPGPMNRRDRLGGGKNLRRGHHWGWGGGGRASSAWVQGSPGDTGGTHSCRWLAGGRAVPAPCVQFFAWQAHL